MDDDTPDIAAAARAQAATELVEAFHATRPIPLLLDHDLARRAIDFRIALQSNGIDLDDLDQAAMVAATVNAIMAVDDDPHVSITTALVTSAEAFSHGIAEADR